MRRGVWYNGRPLIARVVSRRAEFSIISHLSNFVKRFFVKNLLNFYPKSKRSIKFLLNFVYTLLIKFINF